MKTMTLLACLIATPALAWQCPSVLPMPSPGFELVGPTQTAPHKLEVMRLFDGPPGEETQRSPSELAPDNVERRPSAERMTWKFAGNELLLGVCMYAGTKTYYRSKIRPVPKTCTMIREPGQTQTRCD